MKTTLIAACAVMAAVSVAGAQEIKTDFDGAGKGSFQLAGAADVKVYFEDKPGLPAASQPAYQDTASVPVIQGREFTAAEQAELDRSIGSAIAYVQAKGMKAEFAASLECLKKSGTPRQKFEFVYQPSGQAYLFPEACVTSDKGVCDWIVENVCRTITVVSCAWVTSGDNPPITKKECHNEAKEDCKEVKNWVCS